MFQRLAEVAEVSKLSKKARLEYDHALKRYRDTLNAITGAELKGRAEGRAEEKINIARKMLAKGMATKDVLEMTGLTIDDLESVVGNHRNGGEA